MISWADDVEDLYKLHCLPDLTTIQLLMSGQIVSNIKTP